jgi:hypothetical protein
LLDGILHSHRRGRLKSCNISVNRRAVKIVSLS